MCLFDGVVFLKEEKCPNVQMERSNNFVFRGGFDMESSQIQLSCLQSEVERSHYQL